MGCHSDFPIKVTGWILSEVTQSCPTLCNPMDQASPSMEFSRQEYWSGLPYPFPEDLPNPGMEPGSPTLRAGTLPSEPPGKPLYREAKESLESGRSLKTRAQLGGQGPLGGTGCDMVCERQPRGPQADVRQEGQERILATEEGLWGQAEEI